MQIEERWDIKRDAKLFSRLSFGQVKRLISKGMIKEDDLIWHNGLSGWRAGRAKALFPRAGRGITSMISKRLMPEHFPERR